MKLLIVVNPISGGIDKSEFIEIAETQCNYLGIRYKVFETTGNDDASKLKSLLDSFSPDRIMAVGGDGTLRFAAICALERNIPIGIIPMGSANGLARELGVNENPEVALDDFLKSRLIARLDMLLVDDEHYFIHLGDVGINAAIVASYEEDPERGLITYAKYFIDKLRNSDPFDYKISIGDETYTGKAFMIGFCNARKFGTGIPLNTIGNPFDGKFELVIIEQIDMMSLLKAGLAKFDESFFENQYGKVLQANEIVVSLSKPILLQLDGELIGTKQSFGLKLLQGAVPFISHRGNEYLTRA